MEVGTDRCFCETNDGQACGMMRWQGIPAPGPPSVGFPFCYLRFQHVAVGGGLGPAVVER